MCVRARVRGTVWCVVSGLRGVLIGPLIVWNRTNKCVRVSFCADVVVKVWVLFRFFLGEKLYLIWGSRCLGGL